MQSNREKQWETTTDAWRELFVSAVRQTAYISKLDTYRGLRNSLASSCPSLKTLLDFSSPQNISHLMSLRPLTPCASLHVSFSVPLSLWFILSLSVPLCISPTFIPVVIYTSKTYGRSVRSAALFTFSLQIPLLINSAPVCICSKSLLSDALSLPWVCVCVFITVL